MRAAPRWEDIDIEARSLFVRRTLSDVGGHLVFGEPKTRASSAEIGLPSRVVAALEVQATRQQLERDEWGKAYEDQRLVFARDGGAPLRPEHVLKRFGPLCRAAAVTLMIGPVSRCRWCRRCSCHTQLAITADLYGHLTRDIAAGAADTYGAALDAAAAERAAEAATRAAMAPNGAG